MEEKYEKKDKPKNGLYGDKYDEDSEGSSDEDEDDDGFLATEALDAEISATLQAIRNKDPRVYDEKVTFYAPIEEDSEPDAGSTAPKKEKPMYLSDYHRENLLNGTFADDADEAVPKTFVQEQEDLKKSIVKEMHKAAEESAEEENDEDDDFLIPKSKPQPTNQGIHPSRASKVKVQLYVATADKDPETFLSNFMAARAWVPGDGTRFQPLLSDDEDDDEEAEKFEAAYNLRFEDPKGSNEVLRSYARDVIAAKSVRREEKNGRKKQRDALREKRQAEKEEIENDKARLRRLRIDEMEEKLQKIKDAAGIRGKTLKNDEWMKFLNEGWEDDQWEAEMNKRFGDEYYAEQEAGSNSDSDTNGAAKKRKMKKPKWDDDIDIKDIIPEFEEEEEARKKPTFSLSDSENDDDTENVGTPKKGKTSKDRQQERQAKKKAARLERKKIEELVDNQMDLDLPSKSKEPTRFRYRETSPTSFGLTARDILMATDADLNQFAGLKKMATFRDDDKKRKDKKKLGKKARLRQWRKETFGNEDGPEIILGESIGGTEEVADDGANVVDGTRKKKKRSRKNKTQAEVTAA